MFFCTLVINVKKKDLTNLILSKQILFAGGEPVIIALFINTSMSDSCYNFSVLGFYDIR